MSYDICLQEPGSSETVKVDLHGEGGTYVLGGTEDACLNVTYNYAEHFPFRELDGLEARDTASRLRLEVERLGTVRDDDYWNPTEGNVGYALSILAKWGDQHPDAIWKVYD